MINSGTITAKRMFCSKTTTSQQTDKKTFETAFKNVPFPVRYGFWSQDLKPYLFQISHLSLIPFLPTSLVSGLKIPNVNSMVKDSEYAFKSLSDRFSEHDIDAILPFVSDWVGLLLQCWRRHCEENDLTWELKSQYIVNSTGLGRAFLAVTQDADRATLSTNVLNTGKSNMFRELLKARNPGATLYAVYWVHLTVEELWILRKKSTREQVFTSPEHHPNHHIWKFGTIIPEDGDSPLKWQLLDLDDQVRKRIYGIDPNQRQILEEYNVDPVMLWQSTVV